MRIDGLHPNHLGDFIYLEDRYLGTSFNGALPKHIHIKPVVGHSFESSGDAPFNVLVCKHCGEMASGHLNSQPPEVQPTEVDDILKRLVGDPDSYGDIEIPAEKVWQFYNEAKEAIESYCSDQERKAAVSLCGELYELIGNEIDAGVPEEVAWRTVISQTKTDLIAQYERGEYGKN